MRRQTPSLDGFVPRRPRAELGERHEPPQSLPRPMVTNGLARSTEGLQPSTPSDHGLTHADIANSLDAIDEEPEIEPVKKRGLFGRKRRRNLEEKPHKIRRRIIKLIILLIILGVVGVGVYVGVTALFATTHIFKGNIFDVFQNQPLKQDANGRSNILVFGTSEDDEGGDHPGAYLTDSMMVISIDQEKKNAYTVGIPRDLWVKYQSVCPAGYQGKINEIYNCMSDSGQDETAGANALRTKISEITGVDIQYYVHVNYTVVADAVNAVGGVDVKIESSDPRGIYDPNFDWKCGYRCHMVDYKNGEVAHLDGDHALALARARNAEGGYGLPAGNFDRERNQQLILKALQSKLLSAGTLANFGKVTALIDTFGQNLRTNFETKEIRTLVSLAQDITGDKIQSISLDSEGGSVVTTGMQNGQSIVLPVAGLYDYSDIQAFIAKQLTSDPFVKEAATVTVLNGSSVAGAAQKEADALTAKGFTVNSVDNVPADGNYGAIEIYQLANDKPATADKLLQIYGVTPKQAQPPFAVADGTDFVVIVGQAGQ